MTPEGSSKRKRTIGKSADSNSPKQKKWQEPISEKTHSRAASSAHLRKTKKASSEEITITPPRWPKVPKLAPFIVKRLAKLRRLVKSQQWGWNHE
jgi:hypothetical protein